MNSVKSREDRIQLLGEFPSAGCIAPAFELVNSNLKIKSLQQYGATRKLISIVPSVDSYICAISSRRIGAMADDNPQHAFVIISVDLPFAMARFKKVEKLKKVDFLSAYRSADFAHQYGVMMNDGALQGMLARAVLVLAEDNRILYTELVADIGNEPDYEAALAALKG